MVDDEVLLLVLLVENIPLVDEDVVLVEGFTVLGVLPEFPFELLLPDVELLLDEDPLSLPLSELLVGRFFDRSNSHSPRFFIKFLQLTGDSSIEYPNTFADGSPDIFDDAT